MTMVKKDTYVDTYIFFLSLPTFIASTYSLIDLHYLHFLHAIKITERLLLHKHGQLLLAAAIKSQPS